MKPLLRFLKGPLLLAVLLASLMQLFEFSGSLASAEGILLDFFLAKVGRSYKPVPIVSLEINDADFKRCFVYSPMDPRDIAFLVQEALNARPAVIGVDIITDSEQPDDQQRYLTLVSVSQGQPIPIVWAAGVEKSSLDDKQSFGEWLSGSQKLAVQPTAVLGQDVKGETSLIWGLPVYPREEDLHLRRFPRYAVVPPGRQQLNWASKIAERYCKARGCQVNKDAEELFVSFRKPPEEVMTTHGLDLFDCHSKGQHNVEVTPIPGKVGKFEDEAKGGIVLIGGTFSSSRDSYNSPRGVLSGLYINAYTIQAELAPKGRVSEIPPWRRFLLDIGVGLVIGAAFELRSFTNAVRCVIGKISGVQVHPGSVNLRIGISLIGIPFALAIFAVALFFWSLVWLSCVGIAVGMVLHVLVEIWREDLRQNAKHAPPEEQSFGYE